MELWLRKSRAGGTKAGATEEAMVRLRSRADADADAGASCGLCGVGESTKDEDGGRDGRSLRRRLNGCGCCGKKKLSVVAVEREDPVDLPESLRW